MSTGSPLSLAEQRRLVREELAAQRRRLARQLDAPAPGGDSVYPRSATMRWLIREPELVMTLMAKIAGRRVARAVPPALMFLRFLRSVL